MVESVIFNEDIKMPKFEFEQHYFPEVSQESHPERILPIYISDSFSDGMIRGKRTFVIRNNGTAPYLFTHIGIENN